MTIEINDKTTLHHIQKQFRKAYPFLKMRFADKPHQFGEETDEVHWYPSHVRVVDIVDTNKPGSIKIYPYNKAGDIEQLFKRRFNLFPQIFRRDEYKWIQTAGTDIIPVEEQNEIGKKSIEKISGISGIQTTHIL
ncbi:MAG: hypothetical protein ACXWCZ_06605 [Flavisolibacter sp.]